MNISRYPLNSSICMMIWALNASVSRATTHTVKNNFTGFVGVWWQQRGRREIVVRAVTPFCRGTEMHSNPAPKQRDKKPASSSRKWLSPFLPQPKWLYYCRRQIKLAVPLLRLMTRQLALCAVLIFSLPLALASNPSRAHGTNLGRGVFIIFVGVRAARAVVIYAPMP
jgi:hypothetical protein